ncbi:MAG: hypothetical protein Alpg2KO_11310 [Alphaproteobacteria bacterium]
MPIRECGCEKQADVKRKDPNEFEIDLVPVDKQGRVDLGAFQTDPATEKRRKPARTNITADAPSHKKSYAGPAISSSASRRAVPQPVESDIKPLADRRIKLALIEERRRVSTDTGLLKLTKADVDIERIVSMKDFMCMIADGVADAILVDIDMPDGQGVSMMEALRECDYKGPVVLGASEQPRLLPTTARLASAMGLNIMGSVELPIDAVKLLDILRPAFAVDAKPAIPKLTVMDLHQAFMNDEIEPWFQPLMDSRTQDVYGAEALARWRHPDYGIVRPDLFIALAEETQMIGPLTEVILMKSALAVKSWRDNGWNISCAVNVSALSLTDNDFCDRAVEIVKKVGIPTSSIKLEVTESVAMDMGSATETVLYHMREQGFLLALDDFGTGHSSLVSLHRMPFDVLKIDKSFVDNLCTDRDAQIIVSALINLSHDLKMKVVAEGVEDEGIVSYLREYGADYLQGYYYSRPLPPKEFEAWVRATRNSLFR